MIFEVAGAFSYPCDSASKKGTVTAVPFFMTMCGLFTAYNIVGSGSEFKFSVILLSVYSYAAVIL